MSEWTAKRFWTTASAAEADGCWAVQLDGRQVRTPARRPLVVPTQALAEAIAAEWQAQGEIVEPGRMPMTRSANAALDKVAQQRDEVIAYIAEYGATDLLCYRAEAPDALRAQQAAAWDPLLAWANTAYGAALQTTSGIVPVAQPNTALQALRTEVMLCDNFALTALHDLVMLSGSLVIGLAALTRTHAPDTLWEWSRIDESWQAAHWGADEDATAAAAAKRKDFLHAAEFQRLSQPDA